MMGIIGNMMAGCSSIDYLTRNADQGSSPITNEQHQDLLKMLKKNKQNEVLLSQWQQSQDGVNRLLAIESELKVLIGQLSHQLSGENKDTNLNSLVEVEPLITLGPPINMIEKPAIKVEEPAINPDVSGLFAVQLTAMNRKANIIDVWNKLVQQQPNILGGLLPSSERIELPNGPIYRLKVGQFSNLKDANVVCIKLRVKNIPCIINQYDTNSRIEPLKLN